MNKRLKVLIVDDDPVVLEAVRELLADEGFEVHVRDRAMGTTPWIVKERPDIVLLDVDMPGLHGGDVMALSRKYSAGMHACFILHSALPHSQLSELAAETGAFGVLPKDADQAAFVDAFCRLASSHCMRAGVRA